MVEGIINGVPLWVWPLFLVLLLLGLRASKQRQVPAWVSYLLPLMVLFSINTASKLGGTILVWSVFVFCYIVGVLFGFARQKQWLISISGGKVVLAGEWMTLTTMMTVFLANFVAGTLKAVNPDLYQSNEFVIVFTGAIALASGTFLGRAWRVIRS